MPDFMSNTADLDVTIRSSWGSGLVADLTLTAEQALSGWEIAFDYAGDIVNIWNARIVSHSGDRYVVEAMGYNANVGAGATAGFGFQGSGTSTDILPVSINGDAFGDDGAGADPMPPSVSVSDAQAAEAEGTISFDITLSAASDQAVTVSYATMAGSAAAGSDFSDTNGQVVIPAGQLSASVSVALVDDTVPEDTEGFELRLLSANGAEIADGSGFGQITDADMAPPPNDDPVDDP
ncbi:MAG: cellulose binding domain-containing protein, partial [Pseudomonadota bacterium]